VVETGPGYGIWQQTIREFQHLLLRQGAFRAVKRWSAQADSNGQLMLYSLQGTRRHPRELILPEGDRIILVISDCISAAWQGKGWLEWIRLWGKPQVAVIILIPKQM